MMTKRVIMWGAGDQGRVNKPILDALKLDLVALIDDTAGLASPFSGIPLFQGYQAFEPWLSQNGGEKLGFIIAIGNPYGHVRRKLHDQLMRAGLIPCDLIDPSAIISPGVRLGPGHQVMPGAIIHVDAHLGRQCIVNTRALVEHDCVLEDGVEIGPGATLCGRVHVGGDTWIGAGATVLPRVRIGANTIVGAGAVVKHDIPEGVVVTGIPARILKQNNIKVTQHD